jgi:hypothetical protein
VHRRVWNRIFVLALDQRDAADDLGLHGLCSRRSSDLSADLVFSWSEQF